MLLGRFPIQGAQSRTLQRQFQRLRLFPWSSVADSLPLGTAVGWFATAHGIVRAVTKPYNFEIMAKCDQGYLCEVCGDEVAEITESDLYLRLVIGEIQPRLLMTAPERHLRCNPTQSQFIADPGFEPVAVEGFFDKRLLDASQVREREELVTRGWKRLQELAGSGLPLNEYPLPEFQRRREEQT